MFVSEEEEPKEEKNTEKAILYEEMQKQHNARLSTSPQTLNYLISISQEGCVSTGSWNNYFQLPCVIFNFMPENSRWIFQKDHAQ